jgi:hypothetical protein
MTLTSEEMLAKGPGKELDALIAEHIFGWRRIKGPKFDYDGPCESNDVLVPPTITSAEEAFRYMPPKGVIPFTYFVNRGWSKDISAAWEVVTHLMNDHKDVLVQGVSFEKNRLFDCAIYEYEDELVVTSMQSSAPEAICKAALLAVLNL